MSSDDSDVRRLLADAVPPLAAPPDRLAAVGSRVRRRRRRLAAGSAAALVLAVGLTVGVPQLVAGDRGGPRPAPVATGGPVGAAVCPDDISRRPGLESVRYGDDVPLVPAGAVEVTACQVPVGGGPRAADRVGPRVLTAGVDEIVGLLNAMPPINAMPPTRTGPDGRPRVTDPTNPGLRCTLVARFEETAYVLRYPDRAPVTVWTDDNCAVAVTASHGRRLDRRLFGAFLDRYRAQLAAATDPATVATPVCPTSMPVDRVRLTPSNPGPPDRIAVNQAGHDSVLMTPLVALAACRYEVDGESARLVRRETRRDGADAFRPVLNAAFARSVPASDCGDWPGYPPPTAFDTVTVADATGATAEFWVRHTPCRSAVRAHHRGSEPTPELLAALTRLLGPLPR
ncbi:hypothetical protein ACGF5C_10360 [Micromonospora sp. NPDC047620]|uniref:hypothetical protein n=1 Tax=Micromonospora sp. NPDC047620 TaxID=3364251 RepID=UPI003722E080